MAGESFLTRQGYEKLRQDLAKLKERRGQLSGERFAYLNFMHRADEPGARPLMRQGMFSRIDTQRRDPLFNTPNKKARDEEENKENQRNRVNRSRPDAKETPKSRKKLAKEQSPLPEKKRPEPADDGGGLREIREQLDHERKSAQDFKKKYNNEKVAVSHLKSKIKQLEEEKAKQEELHRKSLVNIEQKVATLKNTNLQLLNKAHKFEGYTKELDDMREYKEVIRDSLKKSYEFVMSLLRSTFSSSPKSISASSEKGLRKSMQRHIIVFFQNESETIMELGMQNLFQTVSSE